MKYERGVPGQCQRTHHDASVGVWGAEFAKSDCRCSNSLVKIIVGKDDRILFWEDRWIHGTSVGDFAPRLAEIPICRSLRQVVDRTHRQIDERVRMGRPVQTLKRIRFWESSRWFPAGFFWFWEPSRRFPRPVFLFFSLFFLFCFFF